MEPFLPSCATTPAPYYKILSLNQNPIVQCIILHLFLHLPELISIRFYLALY